MTLPSTNLSMSLVATELGLSTTNLSLNTSQVRTLAGRASGQIAFSDLQGKSAFTPGLTGGGTLYLDGDSGPMTVTLTVNTNGSMSVIGSSAGVIANLAWGSPLVTGIGSSYWVRFTQTATSQTGTGSGGASASTGWLQLSSARSVSVNATKSGTTGSKVTNATYTIEISKDGSTAVATATGYALRVTSVPV